MKVDLRLLLLTAAGIGVIALLPRVVQVLLLRLTGTVVRDERSADRPSSPPW